MKPRIRTISVVVSAVLLLLPWAAAPTMPQLTPFSGDFSSTDDASGKREKTGKIYVNRDHMRWEMTGAPQGGGGIAIINFATRTSDVLMPERHMYIEYNYDAMLARRQAMTPNVKPYPDPNHPCAHDPELTCTHVGVEQVNGRTCDHWRITNKRGEVSNAWIDQRIHFPIKGTDKNTTWELTNIREGEPTASLFQIPPGHQKMDMGSMMQGIRPPQR